MTRKEVKRVDISNIPELLRLAKEVKDTNEAIVLERDGEDLATLSPIRRRSIGPVTKEGYEAFRSAAGGWKDVDTDKLIADIYESRGHSSMEKTKSNYEATLSALGGWKGLVDGEELKNRLLSARGSRRPPVNL